MYPGSPPQSPPGGPPPGYAPPGASPQGYGQPQAQAGWGQPPQDAGQWGQPPSGAAPNYPPPGAAQQPGYGQPSAGYPPPSGGAAYGSPSGGYGYPQQDYAQAGYGVQVGGGYGGAYPMPAGIRNNGLAVAALRLSGTGPLAIILGIIAIGQIKRDPSFKNEWMAYVGIGVGVLSTAVWVGIVIWVLAHLR
ncbi:MAG: DUF4190 domain-containing protein [Polyangiaceae bacterium]|nr:DUF4190 domain-containing protein [Polyangiaceae bacterium]